MYQGNETTSNALGAIRARGPVANQSQIVAVGTEEMRKIVEALNREPFHERLTLVSFDEKTPLNLLELLNKILTFLDPKNNVDIRDEPQDKTAQRLTEFLKVLDYPSNFDIHFQQALVHGEKKIIHSILYWILQRLPELQKRGYLAKFLVPLTVPEEFMRDEELQEVYQQYKQIQGEFQATHQQVEQIRSESMAPNELKREIGQLEQEKDQLVSKISTLKSRTAGEGGFQNLLEATSMLRKEQEEEAKLMDKLREQKMQLDWSENQMLMMKQKSLDLQRATSVENSAEEMLEVLRNEVRRNRELCNERLGRDIMDKKSRLEQMEQLLMEPMVTTSQCDKLENEVRQMENAVRILEEKANRPHPAEDKLAVYKQQAALVSKRKEKAMENFHDLEDQAKEVERKMREKEKEYETGKGMKFMNRDEFKQYANSLRGKTNTYKKLKAELREIKAEMGILVRTETILKSRTQDLDSFLQKQEAARGVAGYTNVQENIEKLSEEKQKVDGLKEDALKELSRVVSEIDAKVKDKKTNLAPHIKELRNLRQKYQEIEAEYNEKKAGFDNVVMAVEGEKSRLETEVKEIEQVCVAEESRYHELQAQLHITDAQLARVMSEVKHLTGETRLNNQFRSHTDWYNWKLGQQEQLSKDLRQHQTDIRENQEKNIEQMKMFQDLQRLLDRKKEILAHGEGESLRGYSQRGNMGEDMLIISGN